MAKSELSKEEKLIKLLKDSKEITLRARWGKTQGALTLCPSSDPITGQMRGVADLTEEEKKKQIRVVTLETTRKISDGMVIKYDNIIDRTDWMWMVYCEELAATRKEAWQSEVCLFYVDDYQQEQAQKVALKERILDAQLKVRALSDAEKAKLMRMFGVNPQYIAPSEISNFLYDKAEKFPDMVLERINDENKEEKLFFYDLVDANIIREDHDQKMFMYGDVRMGTTMAGVLDWLKNPDNIDLVREMQLSLKGKK